MEFIDIRAGDTVVFDVETTGLDWRSQRPCGYVVTVRREDGIISRYYPIRHETGPNLPSGKVLDWIRSWAGLPITLVGHNLKFDLHFAANDGIHFPRANFVCTQVNGALIDEHIRNYSLDNLAKLYDVTHKLGDELYSHLSSLFGGAPDRKQMGNYWRLPADDVLAVDYAVGDGVSTLELFEAQMHEIEVQNLFQVFQLESRVLPTLFKMERRGVHVDVDRLNYLTAWVEGKVEDARRLLPQDFNPRSRTQMAELFPADKHPDLPLTPKGNPSYTEQWLVSTEMGRHIVNLRQFTNLQNSFINPLLAEHMVNGVVNCNFNQSYDGEKGTVTGRLSSWQPNMQQVPKRDKYLAPIFRSIFIPPEGSVWSTNDYSQQEYRVFAAYTRSQALMENYENGVDMHQTVADLLGVERDPTAKRMNLGMLYGMGIGKLADSLGVSQDEARAMRQKYKRMVPEVDKFMRKAKRAMENKGHVLTIMKRRCRLDDMRFSYKAPSRVIQGTCADLTKLKMVEVNDFLERETNGEHGVMLQVHDALDWSIPDTKEGREIDEEARRIMQDYKDYDLRIDMKVDHAHGKNWGEASFPNADWSVYDE